MKKINEMHVLELISNNVRRFRMLLNMSQMELSQCTGLTHNFINDIENCKKGISMKTIAKLSVVFKIEPFQLFLPDNIANNNMIGYVKDFNDSLQKVVSDLTTQYLYKDKKK